MKKIIFSILAISLFSCVSNQENQFMDIYQSELCDKYSLYANNKDLNGILSLYTDDAIINGNAVDAIIEDNNGVAVMIDATHNCVQCRGVKHGGASMKTSKLTGAFKEDSATRNEYYEFIRGYN